MIVSTYNTVHTNVKLRLTVGSIGLQCFGQPRLRVAPPSDYQAARSGDGCYTCLLRGEGGDELGDELLEGSIGLWRDLTVLGDGGQQALVAGLDVRGKFLFEGGDLSGVQFVQVTADTAVDDGDLRK